MYEFTFEDVHQWSRRPVFNPRSSHMKDIRIVHDASLHNTHHYKV